MLTIKEAKKIPFEQLDDETVTYFYELFKKYVVRKQIADKNKELTSLFARRLHTTNPRDYASCFNEFNSCFVGSNLIRELGYDEIHTTVLKDMSEDRFNAHLNARGNTFDRKIALMCFSLRPSERIPNRVDFPVMLAYANMQTRVLELAEKNPRVPLRSLFEQASKDVRVRFLRENGYSVNQSQIATERTDYKSLGKKAAPIWQGMLNFYMNKIKELPAESAVSFVRDSFVFTDIDREKYDKDIDRDMTRAFLKVQDAHMMADAQAEQFPDSYNIADYEELYSNEYQEEIYGETINSSLYWIFDKYLKDPIFAPKTEKEKK